MASAFCIIFNFCICNISANLLVGFQSKGLLLKKHLTFQYILGTSILLSIVVSIAERLSLRLPQESQNDRNDRAIRRVAHWYRRHIAALPE